MESLSSRKQEVFRILKKNRSNIFRGKFRALYTLNMKGYVVFLDTADYKISIHNPILIKASRLLEEINLTVTPRDRSSRTPRIYGLPNIHNLESPLRPVVITFNSPIHTLARYLATTLSTNIQIIDQHIRVKTLVYVKYLAPTAGNVGNTTRRITERRNEFFWSVRKCDNTSALTQHRVQNGHNKLRTISTVTRPTERRIYEDLEIEKNTILYKENRRHMKHIFETSIRHIHNAHISRPIAAA